MAHEYLSSGNITITQPGYVYIYLSNESASQVEVYFDDFKVTQTKSPVIQQEDFYPFGLKFNSFVRESSVPNNMKLFQGQEHIDDLGLNWDSFKWRNHMPDIGRFFNVDPLSEKYVYNSPYAFSENKVTAHVELEGLEAESIKKNLKEMAQIPNSLLQVAKKAVGSDTWTAISKGLSSMLPNSAQKALPKLPEFGVKASVKGGAGAEVKTPQGSVEGHVATLPLAEVKFSAGGGKVLDVGGSNIVSNGAKIETSGKVSVAGQSLGLGMTNDVSTRQTTYSVNLPSGIPFVETQMTYQQPNDSTLIQTTNFSVGAGAMLVLGAEVKAYVEQTDTLRIKK